jgi:hypothetical protein
MHPAVPFAPKGKPAGHVAIRRQMFSADEDRLLRQLVAQFGDRGWRTIASQMPNRTTRQCRERYRNYLAPDLTNEPWSESEDDLLREKFRELGPRWATIARFFKGRSDVALKNRSATLNGRPNRPRFVRNPIEMPRVPDAPVPSPRPEPVSGIAETVPDPVALPPLPLVSRIFGPVPVPAEFAEQLPPLSVEPGQSGIGARDAAPGSAIAMLWSVNDWPAESKAKFWPGKGRFDEFPNYGGRPW